MISWDDFTYTNKNDIKNKFENMCNILFNYMFFDNKATFQKSCNNPGIEIEPILCDGELISFQAKHFSKKNSYDDIFDSCKKTVQYYSGKLNKVYLFCNNDLDYQSKKYKESEMLLKEHNIELIRICNEAIINYIETNNINSIKNLYFGKIIFDDKWFIEKLDISLEELKPRYIKDFNVDVDLQDYFEFIYETPETLNIINSKICKIIEKLSELRKYSKLSIDSTYEKVISKMYSLKISSYNKISNIFDWFSMFIDDLDEIKTIYNQVSNSSSYDKKQRDLNELSDIIEYIEKINFSKIHLFSTIGKKVFLLEGNNGVGKSHLLGFESEKHKNYRTVLLLGQQMIDNKNPMEQIISILGLSCDFDSFLYALEGLGEIDNSNTVIIIDALNESSYSLIWKEYLNKLMIKIESFNHIKLVCSIKTTFKENIFNESINEKIKNNKIVTMVHYGFSINKKIAVKAFFEYYKIPISSTTYLEYEFENPLFLKLFCETYKVNNSTKPNNLIDIFNNYLKYEEEDIKHKLNDYPIISIFDNILNILADYFYREDVQSIQLIELYELCAHLPKYDKYIEMMFKNEILQFFYDINGEKHCHLCYEKLYEIVVAKYLIKKYPSLELIKKYVSEELLKCNDSNYLIKRNVNGIFSILSILIKEKYDYEIIDLLLASNISEYEKDWLIEEFIKSLLYRKDKYINLEEIKNIFKKFPRKRNILNTLFEIMIKMSGRIKSNLNSYSLHDYLMSLSISNRDYLWTYYINGNFYSESTVYELVTTFNQETYFGEPKQKELYGILLSWFFTASNRKLRDVCSRALVKLFINDYELMRLLIIKFDKVNDPYVLQRIYASIYGAILKSKFDRNEAILLCQTIFDNVFDKKMVIPDILLRDYALNTIEYFKYKGCDFNFDLSRCKPPYNSIDILKLDKSYIDKYKEAYDEEYGGLHKIKASMAPQISGYMYGDFGRYVFESALNNFSNVDVDMMFYYALYYIKEILGYNDKYFSAIDREYEKNSFYYESYIERIGKKYQWIAFYHILALVSDKYEYDDKYFDEKGLKYYGSWRPYVRDFDPSLDLLSREKVYDFPFSITQPIYDNWSKCENWVNDYEDVINFGEYIKVTDTQGKDWIMLKGFSKYISTPRYDIDHKEVWKMVSGYFIKKKDYDLFISNLSNKNFIGRWFPESHGRYNIFSREFSWSPAYLDEYRNEIFKIEIDTDEKEEIDYPFVNIIDFDDDVSSFGGKISRNKKKYIGDVLPAWNEYLWEEQYDYSKDSVVSYYLPSKIIIDYFNMEQSQNGIFTVDDEVVAVDFSLVKGTSDGLYIKKDYLDKFLSESEYMIFWICIGEKNDIKKDFGFKINENSEFRDLSSLVYYKDGKMEEINYFGERDKLILINK